MSEPQPDRMHRDTRQRSGYQLPLHWRPSRPHRQNGIAIGVVIVTLVLIAAIGTIMTLTSRDPSNYARIERIKSQLASEGMLLRQQVLRCATDYPAGNNGSNHPAYPAGNGVAASTLTCPGNSGASVFNNVNGVFYPAAVEGCGGWSYYNTATYVRIALTCADNDSIAALQAAASALGNDALLSTTTRTNDTLTIKVIDG